MSLKTQLGITFEEISFKFDLVQRKHTIPIVNIIRNALEKEENNADEIIKDYELTFPVFNIIWKKTNNLLLAVQELEKIQDMWNRKEVAEEGRDIFYVKTCWELILMELTSTLLLCNDMNIDPADFPILNYIREYRNRFIAHPSIKRPFSDFGSLANIGHHPEDPLKLPDTNFGPGSGSDFFCSYHKLKGTQNPEKEWDFMHNKNYEDFIKMKRSDWENMPLEVRSRIITYGLPNPTEMQGYISQEAKKLFLDNIIPYIEKQIDFVYVKYGR